MINSVELFFFFASEGRDLFDRGDDLFGGNEFGALKVAIGTLVTGTPQEVEVVKIQPHIVPTTVAGVIIDHAVRRFKLIGRVGEAGNHDHRHFAAPCQPAQAAGT